MSRTLLRSMLSFVILSCFLAAVAGQVVDEQKIINPSLSQNCTLSHLEANNIEDEMVAMLSYDSTSTNLMPKIPTLNASTWELYFFDAVCLTTSSAITLSFFRDGPRLKVQFLAIWPDGDTFVTEFHASRSILSDCGAEGVTGAWEANELQEGSATFNVSPNLHSGTITLDLPSATGTIRFTSHSAFWTSDATTNSKRDDLRLLTPTVYWLQPIPRASVTVALDFSSKKPLEFSASALGGLDRFWSPLAWPTIMSESIYMRAHAGPYTLLMLRIMSRIDYGVPHGTVYLFENGKCVFETQNELVGLKEQFFIFKRAFEGDIRGSFGDDATGATVDLVDGEMGRHWKFEMRHARVWWGMPTGRTGTGNSGFVDDVSGGEVGGEVFEGKGTAGYCQLPALPREP